MKAIGELRVTKVVWTTQNSAFFPVEIREIFQAVQKPFERLASDMGVSRV